MKKITYVIIVLLSVSTMFSVTSSAVTLLTEEKALKEMFPDMDNVTSETLTLTGDEIALIKERLGGSLFHYQVGSQSENVAEKTDIKFYIGIKNNEKVRVAMIDEQPGKWGPVQFIIALDTSTIKINNLAVMAYVEKRGRPIARQNFLKQFIGKGSSDPISVRSGPGIRIDINAISGATISSDCTCFAVKKAIAIYEEVFVIAVEDHMKMLFTNLLSNAIIYSHERGRVSVTCKLSKETGGPIVTIEDHGIGIPNDKLPKIFDEYYRTDEAVRHNKSSTGLGLAIVHNVAQTHKIIVRVASIPGMGTKFELRFPSSSQPYVKFNKKEEENVLYIDN